MSAADDLLAQESSADPKPKQSETAEKGSTQQKPGSLKSRIEDWLAKHPWLALIVAVILIVLAWFRKAIGTIATRKITPTLTKSYTWVLIHFGAYNRLLKKYLRTLGRRLKEGGLTRQLIGEGVDLEKNYIPIQISKEEYKHPETIPSIGSADKPQTEGEVRPVVEMSKRERVEVSEVLMYEESYGNRIAVIGDPGAGKTTLLSGSR